MKLLLLFFTFCVKNTFSRFFTIAGPRTYIHGHNYSVVLNYLDSGEKTDLQLNLVGSTNGEYFYGPEISLKEYHNNPATVTFELSDSMKSVQDLRLVATSKSEDFEQSVTIHTITKSFSVFIQTDKAVYKPEDEVKFRVLVLGPQMKPDDYLKWKLNITDPNGNVIYTEDEVVDRPIIYMKVFPISDDPVYGDWEISVKIDDDPYPTKKVFEVTEYVLPRFEVFVDSKKHVALIERSITVQVFAKYTFGEYVKGDARVTARMFDSQYPDQPKRTKNFAIKGVSMPKPLKIDMKNDLVIGSVVRDLFVELTVEFIEELTGKSAHKNETVVITRDGNFQIQVIRPQLKLKPGFPYEFTVVVRNPDNSIITKSDHSVQVKATFHYDFEKCTRAGVSEKTIKTFDKNVGKKIAKGEAKFSFEIPTNASAMILNLRYVDSTKVVNVKRFPSRTREYLDAVVMNKKISIGDEIVINVMSSSEINALDYIIVGRTGILDSGSEIGIESREVNITFEATSLMTPEIQMLLYYIHFTGEVVYDYITLTFDENFENELKITPSSKSLKPQEKVSLKFESKPGSTVFLLGVDRSVNLMKRGNDITKSRILDDLQLYNAHKKYGPLEIEGRDMDEDRYLDVGSSNMFILTNAYEGNVECISLRDNVDVSSNPPNDSDLEDTEEDFADFESKTRTEFPETWIFENFDVDESGNYEFEKKVPDTITSWDISAFTLSEEFGFGIAKPFSLTVKQIFFLQLNLPYSIKIGEILKVEVIVFSLSEKQKGYVDVDVTLFNEASSEDKTTKNVSSEDEEGEEEEETATDDDDPFATSEEFEFYEPEVSNGNCRYKPHDKANEDKQLTKKVKLAKKSSSITYFYIKPTSAGIKKLRVIAQVEKNKAAYDEVSKKLKVEVEGRTEYKNEVLLIDLRKTDVFTHDFGIHVDSEAFNNSIKINTSVIGDMIGPAVYNSEKLIKIPSGCWEQRLKSIVPTVAALDYLNATYQLSDAKKSEGKRAIDEGVKQALETRTNDGERKGAFSIWKLRHGQTFDSVWLTAYVMKCFGKAKHWSTFDDKYIREGLEFLSKNQKAEGYYPEYGRIPYYNLKTDSSEGVPLTAFVAIAFLENQPYVKEFKNNIKSALDYINSKTVDITDNYALAIASYCLALGKHSASHGLIEDLVRNAIVSDDEMYWEKDKTLTKKTGNTDRAIMVEIAAYAILAHVHLGKSSEAIPIVNWLVKQRNSDGGLVASHDSVIALQALAEIATKLYSAELDMQIKISYDDDHVEFKIEKSSGTKLQTRKIKPSARHFSVTATGKGLASLQVSHQFNTPLSELNDVFNLRHTQNPSAGKNTLHLTVCASYKQNSEDDAQTSGMTIIEIAFPSGFVADPTFDVLKNNDIRKFEMKNDNSFVVLYFDAIGASEICPEVQAIRQRFVSDLKQSSIKVYEYTAPERRTIEYYLPLAAQKCS